MLAIGIDDEDVFAGGVANARLDRCAIALVVRVSDDTRTGGSGDGRRLIGRPVVDDKHLPPLCGCPKSLHDGTDRSRFLEGWNHDGHGRWIGHACKIVSCRELWGESLA